MRRATASGVLAVALLVVPVEEARGGVCPAIAGGAPALAAIDAETRIEYIHSRLVKESRRAHAWTWTWVSIYSTLAVGTLVLGETGVDARVDGWINSGSAAIGALSILVLPLHVMRDARRLDERIARAAGGGDRCAL